MSRNLASAVAFTTTCALCGSATARADEPAYRLGTLDVATYLVAIPFATGSVFRTQPPWCAPQCDPKSLNALDRTTAGWWRPGWSTASDVGIGVLGLGAATLLFTEERLGAAWKDAIVVGEAALVAAAVASVAEMSASRPRPFVYGDAAPLSERTDSKAALSFVSSHSAVSFALATSTAITAWRVDPTSPLGAWALGVGLAGASFVGVARVLAGRHFPTDVTFGAMTGTAIGILVPALHEAPAKIVPTAGGASLIGAF